MSHCDSLQCSIVFCVTLLQPAVFYSVLALYLRTHSILKPTYVKDCKHYSLTYCCFCNHFCALSQFTVQLTVQFTPFKMNCGTSVGWKNYCVHFVFQRAYINLILFSVLQLSAVTVFISEGISRFISLILANMKSRHKNFEHPKII